MNSDGSARVALSGLEKFGATGSAATALACSGEHDIAPSVAKTRSGLNILHLISSGGLYGAETMAVALCKRLQEEGHTSLIGVFHNSHAPNTEVADHARSCGVRVALVPCNGRLDYRTAGRLRRLIQEQHIDAVH